MLMTVHSAKGLEFPVVFLPGNGGKHFPGHGERICTVRSGGGTPFSVCCHHACKRGAVHFPRGIPHDLRHDEPQPRFTLCGRNPGDARRAHRSRGYSARPVSMPSFGGAKPFGEAPKTKSVAEAGGFTPKPRVKPAPAGTYRVGDTVLHKAFGTGLIVSATPMANDTLLEVSV